MIQGGDMMRKRKPNLKLKALRAEHGLNQVSMAELLGMGHITYNRKENGVNEFTETECEKISNFFDVSPTDIFFKNYVTKRTTKSHETA